MDITYDYYRIFYYVAKYKSFTRAATVLMNNQPNISRAMNNLEKQLGCTLFLRSNRGISLTPEGKKLYNHVSVAYRHLQAAELELSGSNTLESGNVTISASETALHGILLDVLRDFHNAYPNIHIHILSHTTPEAIQTVRSGLADFCVVTSPTRVRHPFKETVLPDVIARGLVNELCHFPHEDADLGDLDGFNKNTITRSSTVSDGLFRT